MRAACLLLILAVKAEVLESTEDPSQTQNVTTLYPVSNKTDLYTRTNCRNESESHTIKLKSKTDATTWKLEAAFGETNFDKEEDGNITNSEEKARESKNSTEFKPSQPLGSFFDDEVLPPPAALSGPFTPMFKQPASGFVSFPKQYHSTYEIPKEVHQEPPQGHAEFPYKFEKTIFTKAKGSWTPDILESKPTAEVPVRVPAFYGTPGSYEFPGLDGNPPYKAPANYESTEIKEYPKMNGNTNIFGFPNYGSAEVQTYPQRHGKPGCGLSGIHGKPLTFAPSDPGVPAGGLYKLTDPFKEDPAVTMAGEYGWEHNTEIVESHKKRVNPLKNLLHLITAFLPVGLIISALTPSVITIQNTQQPSNPYRRSDTVPEPDVPPISERCRRRLLCELQSDSNYSSSPKGKRKHCYKIYCEDTQAVWRLLHWLLTRHRPGEGYQTSNIT